MSENKMTEEGNSLENFDEEKLKREYEENNSWGLTTGINLYGCNPEYIRSAEKIKEYVSKLCDLLKVKKFGECIVVDFGENPQVTGFSMMQLIETSLISGHFGMPETPFAYLDIFSCAYYNPKLAIEFSAKFFEAKSYTFYWKIRK
jgi:S-adenosylmethionine decarboxylase